MQFSRIGISNFRIFNEEFNFQIKPITILTGTNSSGKSTLIKAIRLLQSSLCSVEKDQSNNLFEAFNELILNNDLNLGHYDYWFNKNKDRTEISYSFPIFLNCNFVPYKIIFTYDRDKKVIPNGELKSVVIQEENNGKKVISIDSKGVYVDVIELWTQVLLFHDFSVQFMEFENILKEKIKIELPWLYKEDDLPKNSNDSFSFGHNYLGVVSGALFSSDKVVISEFYSGKWSFTHKDLFRLLNKDQQNVFLECQKRIMHYNETNSNPNIRPFPFDDIVDLDFRECKFNNYENFLKLWEMMSQTCKEFDPAIPLICYDFEKGVKTDKKLTNQKEKLFLKIQNEEIIALNDYLNFNDKNLSFFNLLSQFGRKLENINNHSTTYSLINGTHINKESNFESFILNKKGTSKLIIDNLIKGGSINREIHNPNDIKQSKTNLHFFIDSILNPIKSLTEDIPESIENIQFVPTAKILIPRRQYILKEGDYFDNILLGISKLNNDKLDDFYSLISDIIKSFGIAESLEIEFSKDGVACVIFLRDFKNDKLNLADYGNGIIQILPTILFLGLNYIKKERHILIEDKEEIVIIEEPESNLHPALQSKLADLFIYLSSRLDCRFIIETHSEYLIRKLQILSLDKESRIKKEDIQIYYFYHPDAIPEGQNQILSIQIENDGSLSKNFGTGFFDESSNLNLDLYFKHKMSMN